MEKQEHQVKIINKEVKRGIRVEQEHKKTINFIKSYFKKHKSFPPNRKIFASISRDHLKEDARYYQKLQKAKL